MGMFDTFWGTYTCPCCNREVKFEEQTKEYENVLADFLLGDYIDKGNRNYFYDFIYECPYCDMSSELSIAVRNGQYVGVYYTEEAKKIDIMKLRNIEDGYQRNRDYDKLCIEKLGRDDAGYIEGELVGKNVGDTLTVLRTDWKVLDVFKEELSDEFNDEEKSTWKKFFYRPSFIYRAKADGVYRIIAERKHHFGSSHYFYVYEDGFDQLNLKEYYDEKNIHRYKIQDGCKLVAVNVNLYFTRDSFCMADDCLAPNMAIYKWTENSDFSDLERMIFEYFYDGLPRFRWGGYIKGELIMEFSYIKEDDGGFKKELKMLVPEWKELLSENPCIYFEHIELNGLMLPKKLTNFYDYAEAIRLCKKRGK